MAPCSCWVSIQGILDRQSIQVRPSSARAPTRSLPGRRALLMRAVESRNNAREQPLALLLHHPQPSIRFRLVYSGSLPTVSAHCAHLSDRRRMGRHDGPSGQIQAKSAHLTAAPLKILPRLWWSCIAPRLSRPALGAAPHAAVLTTKGRGRAGSAGGMDRNPRRRSIDPAGCRNRLGARWPPTPP